jgi:dienelactone hydrolase
LGSTPDQPEYPCHTRLAYALHLVKRGYVTLTPHYYANMNDCDFTVSLDKKPFGYHGQTLKNLRLFMRSIDLLQSLPSVQQQMIGCIGHSIGGLHAVLLSLFEQRIAAVVSSCGFEPLMSHFAKGSALLGSWDTYMPRVQPCVMALGKNVPFDFDTVLSALCPRPVFISISAEDALAGAEDAAAKARNSYGKFKDRFVIKRTGAHDFPDEIRDAAYCFFADWL